MGVQIYCRMLGYVVTIALHGGNIVYMAIPPPKEVMEDPGIKTFSELQSRFLTCWTFFLQLVYAVAGLTCDILTLKNSSNKKYNLPKYLRGFRDTLFAGVVWPSSIVVFTVFWPLFLYDRSLVFPEFLDKMLTTTSNHIMHTAILPIVLWEVLFLPRKRPSSHKRYLGHMIFHFLLYVSVLIYTYIERGTWVYPIATQLYGTVYFPLLILGMLVLAFGSYFSQWTLYDLIHSSVPEKPKKKIR